MANAVTIEEAKSDLCDILLFFTDSIKVIFVNTCFSQLKENIKKNVLSKQEKKQEKKV